MSRTAHQRQQQKLQLQQQLLAQQQMAENEAAAAAAELFDLFCVATTMRQILGLHRNMCELIGLRPSPLNEFYPKLKLKIRSWKAQALWKKFDTRASQRVYAKGNACTGTRVLVIGAGPCGLRTAIEAQLLGAKVVVVEKRDRVSRNNVLHLWPFVITDLRSLGAKKFYGKFCAGSIDHISIRQLQCILLKVALLLGVEVHEGVSFERTIEPSGDGCGWRAAVSPSDHAVSHYEFDVLIGADGKRNTLEGFKRKEFRGKLAIAITANFINKKTEAEAKAEEISGVAFIFNQSFFKELYHTTGIDLENIVYYKDETHYFVMTAKKHSLIDKGVIVQDFADPAELLASGNVNTEKLLDYAREAAEFSTKYQMPNLEFAVNHYGKPDVAMFDFTSMFAAESSCRVIVRKNFRLLQCLVGDSLLEPFWPTGSGCARGFLSSMDAAYIVKLWSNPCNSILGVVAQRESIYRLLNQTTPENLQRDIGSYTVDPATRYPNLNRTSVNVWQIKHLIDTDDKSVLEQTFMDTNALQITQVDTPMRRKRRSGDVVPLSSVLLRWICCQLHAYDFVKDLKEVSDVFTHGKILCALINRYRPDLVDFNAIQNQKPAECNDLAFRILEKEMHIPRIMNGKESLQLNLIDSKLWLNYLEQICEVFRGEIPHVKHPKIDFSELRDKYRLNNAHAQPDFSKLLQLSSKQKAKSPTQNKTNAAQNVARRTITMDDDKLKRQRRHDQIMDNHQHHSKSPIGPGQNADTPRKAKKRRNIDKATNIDRERGDIGSSIPRGGLTDGQFSDRIKSMEQRITARCSTDKKPKDLMRAIGRIDSNDWQIREIKKKMEQCKKTEVHGPKGREKVPKWSKEQFQARQNKMAKPNRQDSSEEKYKEIDQTLKNVDKQLKEGHIMDVGERGRNKVASIAGQFIKRDDTSEENKTPSTTTTGPKSSTKVALAFKKQTVSEKCHFCKQTVYLMEKLHIEDLVMHRGCLKCHHCHTNLRLGGYAFDRDDPDGRFYCTQHFRLPAKAIRPLVRKMAQKKTAHVNQSKVKKESPSNKTAFPENITVVTISDESKRHLIDNVTQMEMLDRGQTPERIEFENIDAMSDGEPSEEHIIDEHEWSGRNFLPESNNDVESDISTSDESDTESDSDIYEEANDSPLGVQTLQLATDWIGKQHYTETDNSDEFYDSSEGIADDGKDDTEGEEFQKARELRREEVRLQPLPNLPTDTETEKIMQENMSSEINQAKEDSNDLKSDVQITKKKSMQRKSSETFDDHLSEQSFKSTKSFGTDGRSDETNISLIRRRDIEKLEERGDRKLSTEIDAISEKLYHLNNIMKMNKDLETMAKENLIRSDILKKLTLKEKWLSSNNNTASNSNNNTKFENKIERFLNAKLKTNDDSVLNKIETSENILRSKENVVHTMAQNNSKKTELNMADQLTPEAITAQMNIKHNNDKVDIENILNVVKSINLTTSDQKPDNSSPNNQLGVSETHVDNKSKENWINRFSNRMESIKSQIVEPTINAQTSSNVDLSKYFPSEKSQKPNSLNVNKNQKTLKDIDLTKYFPNSPTPQRSTNVVTVADKLKKSKGEQNVRINKTSPTKVKDSLSLKDHQLDGSLDVLRKKSPVKVVTSAVAVAKKGNVKIIKKIVPKGSKSKKSTGSIKLIKTSKKSPKTSIEPQDNSDQLLDEILHQDYGSVGGCDARSPSSEYLKLFKEEKSPSEDISDKIDCILQSEGIDIHAKNKHKRILKTKSLGEEEFQSRLPKIPSTQVREDGDVPISGVQNILKRFESLNSCSSSQDFLMFKLQRSKSSLQNSRDSLMSNESILNQSDLDKTMEYLKTEWKNEASNFLQRKRSCYFPEKTRHYEKEKLKCKGFIATDLVTTLEKRPMLEESFSNGKNSFSRKNENTLNKSKEVIQVHRKPIIYTSLEELALVSLSKKERLKQGQDTKNLRKNNYTMHMEKENMIMPKKSLLLNVNEYANSAEKCIENFKEAENNTEKENVKPFVEDIKNLPKTGCDKSLSNSRQSSQPSTQLRMSLDAININEKNDAALNSNASVEVDASCNSEIYSSNNMKILNTHSQSPVSAVSCRASSSEEDSIEKLFNQFSDEMLVNIEFDSNDELIAITPRATLLENQENGADVISNVNYKKSTSCYSQSKGVYEEHFKTLQFTNDSECIKDIHCEQKSTSSSNDATETSFLQDNRRELPKLSSNNKSSTVQDLTKQDVMKDASECNTYKGECYSETKHMHNATQEDVIQNKNPSIVKKYENVEELKKVLTPTVSYREKSLEWNMENLPTSPLPRRQSAIIETHSIDNSDVQGHDFTNNNASKESLLQKSNEYSKESIQAHEKLTMNPVQMINDLDTNTEAATHRLIEKFEKERRHTLMQRDKQFLDMEKSDVCKNAITPNPVNDSVQPIFIETSNKQSSSQSRSTSSQRSLGRFNKDGTPPMMKPLDIGSDLPSQRSSRCSSFALIELSETKPIIAPMPKKLVLPKIQHDDKPVNLNIISENTKYRPWPKPQDQLSADEEENVKNDAENIEKIQVTKYANATKDSSNDVELKRQWPDGKTVFKADISEVKKSTNLLSKSMLDITSTSVYSNTKDQLYNQGRSSADNEPSHKRIIHVDPQYNIGKQHKLNTNSLDANTRILLDRSKRLHDQKCDFINERAAERNPYLREAMYEEKKHLLSNTDSDADSNDILTKYRAKKYSNYSTTRFPKSHYSGRPHTIQRYDYTPSHNIRQLPIIKTLPSPLSSTSSLNRHYNYQTSSDLSRPAYKTKSPSLHKDLKDSCVLN